METLRQTTKVARISDLVNGEYVRKEGMEPSYILTNLGEKISRAKIVGTIVDKFMSDDGNYSSITIDDDTDAIRAKAFKEDADFFEEFDIGDHVMLIGKVREYNDENYIIPEILKRVDHNYNNYHKLRILKDLSKEKKISELVKEKWDKFADLDELKKYMKKKHGIKEEEIEGILESLGDKEEKKEKDYKPMLLELIDGLDEGKGVTFKKLLKESDLEDDIFQEAVNELLAEGICYEPKPGVIKRV
jgi:hypothetical protein